ncbi:MAG: DUF4363 family protein [Bacillota bacterium]|nr:DUF4363 family protein [Bacillota bacterium]
MKALYWAIAVLLLLIAVCIASVAYIVNSAAYIGEPLPELQEALADEDWPRAELLFGDSYARWQQAREIWPLLINHDDMRDIEVSYIDTQTVLTQQSAAKAQKEVAALEFYIQHVAENERVSWQSVI